MFQLCKLEDSLCGLTSGSRSWKSWPRRMHRHYEIICTRVPTSRQSVIESYGQPCWAPPVTEGQQPQCTLIGNKKTRKQGRKSLVMYSCELWKGQYSSLYPHPPSPCLSVCLSLSIHTSIADLARNKKMCIFVKNVLLSHHWFCLKITIVWVFCLMAYQLSWVI